MSAPDLPALRERLLCELAEGVGLETDSPHGFTPHVTLAFLGPDEPHPRPAPPPLDLAFSALGLWIGAEREVFAFRADENDDGPCDAADAALSAVGAARPVALAGVVNDWAARSAARLRDLSPAGRARWVPEGLDDLHTRLLAAFLAAPARPAAGAGAEEALRARAARVRSVETDLSLILGTVARDLGAALDAPGNRDVEGRLRDALRPILVWAAAVDEEDAPRA